MNKKGDAAGLETGRWMGKHIGYVFFFVIVAGFVYIIITSFVHRDIDTTNAVSFSAVNAVAECMKANGAFSLERASVCNRWNDKFGAVYTLNGKSSDEINPAYLEKAFCHKYKGHTCGKDNFADKSGNLLTIDWVMKP